MSVRSSQLVACALSSALLASACLTDAVDDRSPADQVADPDPVDEPSPPELPERGTGYVRTAQGILPVSYQRVGDYVRVQGDILIRVDEFVRNQIAPENLDLELARPPNQKGAVRTVGAARWPGGVIPYEVAPGLSGTITDALEVAMLHWGSKTPIRFRLKTSSDVDYVRFQPGTDPLACTSAVGRQGGMQPIELVTGCGFGEIVHEIGHAVGFFHEQSRLDRDFYVQINTANIKAGYEFNFEKFIGPSGGGAGGTDSGLYDFDSIMHYGRFDFSKNGLATIVPTSNPNANIGQRNALSPGDIDAARKLHSAAGNTVTGAMATLTSDPNYAGAIQPLLPGFYASDLLNIVGDNRASSLVVPAGLAVELWTGGATEPRAWFYDNYPQLPAPYDNNVSQVFVVRAATAFRESNQWGVRQTFRVGEYRLSAGQMSTVGIGVSSILVPDGLLVELCTSESGSGCQTFEGSVNFVGSTLNDQVRLIRVKPAVTLFQEIQLGGNRKSFPVGTYTSFAPVSGVSSLVADRSLKAKICRNSNGTDCIEYRGDVSFVGPGFNDLVRYLKVEASTIP